MGKIEILEGTGISRSPFHDATKSVVFECTSQELCCENGKICEKSIEWSPIEMRFKKTEKPDFYARCVYVEGLPVCKIFAGDAPAQAKTTVKSFAIANGNISATLEVENSGELPMSPGEVILFVYKRIGAEWIDTKQEFEVKETALIQPRGKQTIIMEGKIITPGQYKAIFKAEAPNAGYGKAESEFIVGENTLCEVDEGRGTETLTGVNPNEYKEVHYCTGCNYAYECSAAWEESTGKTFEAMTLEKAYCVKTTENGSC